MASYRSVLLLGKHQGRRLAAADSFRSEAALVVEVTTIQQANAILRQLRFDVFAVDFCGLGVGVIQLLHDVGVDYPDTCLSVIGPPVDRDVLARFHRSGLPYRPTVCGEERLGSGVAKRHCEGESDSDDGLDRIRGAEQQKQTDIREGK